MPWTHRSFWLLPLLIGLFVGLFVAIFSRVRQHPFYRRQFAQTRRERLFLASVGFFTAAAVVRGVTIAIHNGVGFFHDVSMHGRHIHHLVWGILLLLGVSHGWLLKIGTGEQTSPGWIGRLMSLLYGVAAALTLDEFALWLNLRDVYWEREGHESFEALALFGGILCIGIFGGPLFQGIAKDLWRREAK
jgi:hypothetical protein